VLPCVDHIDMQLSVRLTGSGTADFLVTNFTFYDCSVHTSYVPSLFHRVVILVIPNVTAAVMRERDG